MLHLCDSTTQGFWRFADGPILNMFTTKKEVGVFSKYALFILLAIQVLCCESVDSAVVPRGVPHRSTEGLRRHSKFNNQRVLRASSAVISAPVDRRRKTSSTKIVAAAEPEITLNAFDLCLCGAFATAFGDFVMHPVDTIKVSQQVRILRSIQNSAIVY